MHCNSQHCTFNGLSSHSVLNKYSLVHSGLCDPEGILYSWPVAIVVLKLVICKGDRGDMWLFVCMCIKSDPEGLWDCICTTSYMYNCIVQLHICRVSTRFNLCVHLHAVWSQIRASLNWGQIEVVMAQHLPQPFSQHCQGTACLSCVQGLRTLKARILQI